MNDHEFAGENESQEPPTDEASQHIAPIDPSQIPEDDEISRILRAELEEALDQAAIKDTAGREEDPPQPEPTPEQTARIIARPRKVPKPRAGPSSSRGPSLDFPSRPSPQQPLPQPANSDPSPEQLDPQSTAEPPKDKGKGKEVLFDVPAHERPLTREEAEGLQCLTTAQTLHLVERFRAQIAAESRRAHRDEFYSEMQEEMQLTFDRRLAEEKGMWAEEKGKWAEEKGKWAEENWVLNESVRTMDRNLRASFEKGKKSATDEHAARWSSIDSQLADKEKRLQIREQQLGQERTRLEGLSTDQTNVLATRNAAQAQQIAALTQENDRLREEAAANVEQLRQLWEKEEEAKRVRAEMVTNMGNLEQQLAAQTQVTTRVQNQLVTELWTRQEDMRASVRRQERREQALTQLHCDQLRQLRTEHQRNRYHPFVPSTEMDNDVAELAGQMSTLRIAKAYEASASRLPIRLHHPDPLIGQMEDDRAPVHAISTSTPDGRLRQLLTDEQSRNEQLQKDLANEKTTIETLRKSLADCQAKSNQPPVDNCAARLQDLQARLDKKHAQALKEQQARMMEGFRTDADAFLAQKDSELTKISATAEEESRRSQEVIAGLKKDLETCRAELEREKEGSRVAKEALQSLQEGAKEHWNLYGRLERTRRDLQVTLDQRTEACESWSTLTEQLRRDVRRAKRTTEAVRAEAGDFRRAYEAAEAESSSLRTANRALEEEKHKLKAKFFSTTANLNAKLESNQKQSENLTAELTAELGKSNSLRTANRALEKEKHELKAESLSTTATLNAMLKSNQKQSENLAELTAELGGVRARLAASQATIKKEVAGRQKFVDARLEAWAQWEAVMGGREMDAPLGVSEKANKGFLRTPFPWWKQLLFWVLLFFALVVAGFSKISADRQKMQRWLA